jgi:hypothetical protein
VSDWKELMPLEHHEPVTCVTFSLDADTQVAASRVHFRRRMVSRRMLVRLAIGALLFGLAGWVLGIAIDDPDPIGVGLLFGGERLMLFPVLCLILYLLIPLGSGAWSGRIHWVANRPTSAGRPPG